MAKTKAPAPSLTKQQQTQIAKGRLTVEQANKRNARDASSPKTPTKPGTGSDLPKPGAIINDMLPGVKDVIKDSQRIRDEVIDYGKDNQFIDTAKPFIDDMLAGNMGRNPWEADLYSDIGDLGNPSQAAFEGLLGYLGGKSGPASERPGSMAYGAPGTVGSAGTSFSYLQGGNSGGGQVPDTVGGQNTFFAQKIKELFDPANLDPANNPTLQPLLEALRRENVENYNQMSQDLSGRAEGSGLYGTGAYDYLMERGREESMESLDQAMAQLLYGDYNAAQERRMQGLGETNQRDIAAMADATNRAQIAAASGAAGAASAAAAADAAEGRKLQALGMLMGGGQDLLNTRAGLADMRQSGQLGALGSSLGFANLGLEGYGLGLNADQNRLSGLGLMGDVAQGISNADLQRQGLAIQRGNLNLARQGQEFDQSWDNLNNMLNVMLGIGGAGGTTTGTEPGTPYVGGVPPWLQGVATGIGTGANAYDWWNKFNKPPAPSVPPVSHKDSP